jgi:hypothetical protein
MEFEKNIISLRQSYEEEIRVLKDKYQAELRVKDEQINDYRKEIAYLRKLSLNLSKQEIKITSNNNHKIEVKSMSESETSKYIKYDQSKANIGVNVDQAQDDSQTTGIGVQHNYAPEQKQTLAEAATEIQQLLNQLEQSYPTEVPTETQEEINVAVRGIAKNPALSQRVVGALKGGGMEALRELADNAYVNILLAAWEGWQKPE